MNTVLAYLDAHPVLWGYVIIPLFGFVLNELVVLLAARWPRLAPVAKRALEMLPALPGAYERWRRKSLPPPAPEVKP